MVYYNLYSLSRNAPGLINVTASLAASSDGQLDALQPWKFYLDRALNTTLAMWSITGGLTGYAQYGLMVGSGFGLVMDAAAAEAAADPTSPYQWGARAAAVEAILQQRVALWASLPFPFGSEVRALLHGLGCRGLQFRALARLSEVQMPWDSTGQEEIETWSARYGAYACANATLDSVLAYTPSVPHWAYHGASRRYFDFGVNGKREHKACARAFSLANVI
jgi:hypothetical protein